MYIKRNISSRVIICLYVAIALLFFIPKFSYAATEQPCTYTQTVSYEEKIKSKVDLFKKNIVAPAKGTLLSIKSDVAHIASKFIPTFVAVDAVRTEADINLDEKIVAIKKEIDTVEKARQKILASMLLDKKSAHTNKVAEISKLESVATELKKNLKALTPDSLLATVSPASSIKTTLDKNEIEDKRLGFKGFVKNIEEYLLKLGKIITGNKVLFYPVVVISGYYLIKLFLKILGAIFLRKKSEFYQ